MNTTNPSPADSLSEAEIAEAGTMRPLEAVPSAWEIKGNPRINVTPTLESFSPEQRQQIVSRAGSTNPDSIKAAIHAHMLDKSRDFRIRAGAGEGATETERAALEQTNNLRHLSAEHARIEAELADVVDYQIERDENGNALSNPVPQYRYTGGMRTAKEARLAELKHEMSLLAGVEGERQLREAQKADALRHREMRAQIAEQQEVTRRAHEIAREDRIERMARQRAKFLGDTNL